MQKNGMDLLNHYQITLYLGSQCNLHCAYCHREASDGEGEIAESFLEELKRNPPGAIKFMGGEPLLYMKEIRKVVAAVPIHRDSVVLILSSNNLCMYIIISPQHALKYIDYYFLLKRKIQICYLPISLHFFYYRQSMLDLWFSLNMIYHNNSYPFHHCP